MPAAAELQEEFSGPVAYADSWVWIALVLLLLVVLYYLWAWWFTRAPRVADVVRPEVDVPDVQRQHLARIDEVEAAVRSGSLEARDGHQQLSEVVRSYVDEVTTLPARTMVLADFRVQAPRELVEAIEVMYPPEFAPDDDLARGRFDDAVGRARRLVTSWT
jgi:hypothetical protein